MDVYDGFPYDLYEMFPNQLKDPNSGEAVLIYTDALEFIQLVSEYRGVIIWGIDVLTRELDYTYDSWDSEYDKQTDTVTTAHEKGCKDATDYINRYVEENGDNFLYAFTLSKEDEEHFKLFLAQTQEDQISALDDIRADFFSPFGAKKQNRNSNMRTVPLAKAETDNRCR